MTHPTPDPLDDLVAEAANHAEADIRLDGIARPALEAIIRAAVLADRERQAERVAALEADNETLRATGADMATALELDIIPTLWTEGHAYAAATEALSQWRAALATDRPTPTRRCDVCGRETTSAEAVWCKAPRPDGTLCHGLFRPTP